MLCQLFFFPVQSCVNAHEQIVKFRTKKIFGVDALTAAHLGHLNETHLGVFKALGRLADVPGGMTSRQKVHSIAQLQLSKTNPYSLTQGTKKEVETLKWALAERIVTDLFCSITDFESTRTEDHIHELSKPTKAFFAADGGYKWD